jgi:chemotaxis-related protein WspB
MLVLTFQVGPDAVGLDIRRVREVIPRVRLRPLTGGPGWLAGVFVYRGRVIPVVDLPRLAGHGECPPHLSSRIVLVPVGDDRLIGLLAGQVADLRDVNVTGPSLPSPAGGGVDLGPVVADGPGVIRLLDPDRLLPADARAVVLAAGGAA